MSKQRIAGQFYTKEALSTGDMRQMDVAWKVATDDEMMKELGVTSLDDIPDGYVAGWASTTDVDSGGDVVLANAMDDSIAERGITGPRGIKFLLNHKRDQVAGVIMKLEKRAGGLWIEAQMALDIGYVSDFYKAAKLNGGLSFSIGYRLMKGGFRFVDKGEEDSYWELSKIDLHEVSAVPFPMNENAQMTFIKDNSAVTDSDIEKALAGFYDVSRNQAKEMRKAYDQRVFAKKTLEVAAQEERAALLAAQEKALTDVSSAAAALKSMFQTPEKE